MSALRLYAPAVVLIGWAAMVVVGATGDALKVVGLILLTIAVALHAREDRAGRCHGRR